MLTTVLSFLTLVVQFGKEFSLPTDTDYEARKVHSLLSIPCIINSMKWLVITDIY